ncbi:MAG: MATE family efflux transporter [Clostridia bacterium]
MRRNSSESMDLYTGSIVKKMIIFSAPLMITGILQLLYNAADMVVVGRFAGKEALSAVGATSVLINLFINIFIGLSLGASVVVSKYYGANDPEGVSETVHSSILLSICGGVIIMIAGWIFAKPILILMQTPADVLDGAVLYTKIYFSGMPFNMVYNYGAAILRSVGDTKRPLRFLTIAGIVNVVLNLIFVIVFKMGVAGVGLATIASQAVSMVLVVHCLTKSESIVQLDYKKLAFHKDKILMLLKVGLPAGLQSCCFSLSNLLIQSSINIFGTVILAGNTAATNVESFLFVSANAFNQTNITFVSQNIGAKQYSRVRKCFCLSVVLGLACNFIISSIFILFNDQLVSLYSSEIEVTTVAASRLAFISLFHFSCVCMHIFGGQLQAMGRSFIAMIVTLCGVCAFRVVWIFTFFQANKTIENLYLSYPVSWGLTAMIHLIFILYFIRSFPKKDEPLME